jgi:trypsin
MERRATTVALVFSCGFAWSCQGPSWKGREAASAIIGGSIDSGDPGVVALLSGVGLCTTEVISPTVLLTAAHCVDPSEVGPNAQFDVVSGTDINSGTSIASVVSTHFDQAFDINQPQNGHDVGIVILSSPGITNITPLPFNRTPMSTAMVGESSRLVGYGLSDVQRQSGAGTKRQVTTVLDDFDNLLLHIGNTGQSGCSGDSGGPAFMNINGVETIVGVTSFGSQDCSGGGYYTRIDQYVSFIQQYLGACSPMCAGRTCGPDGCGGSCGGCGSGQSCNAAGQCRCAPQCAGKNCGPDGCGGSCGACGPSESCSAAGECMSNTCTRQCAGKQCGSDGCGGTCGTCGANESCSAMGQCVSTNACDAAGGRETEPNDDQMHAGSLCTSMSIHGSIARQGDVDWFTWTIDRDRPYTVHLRNLSHDTEMMLFKVVGGQASWIASGVNNHDQADQAISRRSATGGTYFLLVRGVNGTTEPPGRQYEVSLTLP